MPAESSRKAEKASVLLNRRFLNLLKTAAIKLAAKIATTINIRVLATAVIITYVFDMRKPSGSYASEKCMSKKMTAVVVVNVSNEVFCFISRFMGLGFQ